MGKDVYAIADCFTRDKNGDVHRLVPGDAWPADHPVVRLRPQLFADRDPGRAGQYAESFDAVEQATAAPGERRTTRRAKK